MRLAKDPDEHVHERSFVREYANMWLGMAIFPPYPKCPDAARTSSQVRWLLHIMQVANGLHRNQASRTDQAKSGVPSEWNCTSVDT
jgi:hypothetical protein